METLPSHLKCRSLVRCRINKSEKENHIPRGSYPRDRSRTKKKKGPSTKYTVSLYHNCSCFFSPPLQVLEDQQNIRLIRELLQTLYTSLCTLVKRVGKSVLVGNINMWVYRMETILHWQQQLNNIQITRVSRNAPASS